MVKQALAELQNALDAPAYLALKTDVEAVVNLALPEDAEDRERNKSPLLVGQLKNLSKPFYNHLRAIDVAWLDKEMERAGTRIPIEGSDPAEYSPYPWPSPEDFSSATNSTVA